MFQDFEAPEEPSVGLLARPESTWHSGSPDHTSIDLQGFDWSPLPSSEVVTTAYCFGGVAREVAY